MPKTRSTPRNSTRLAGVVATLATLAATFMLVAAGPSADASGEPYCPQGELVDGQCVITYPMCSKRSLPDGEDRCITYERAIGPCLTWSTLGQNECLMRMPTRVVEQIPAELMPCLALVGFVTDSDGRCVRSHGVFVCPDGYTADESLGEMCARFEPASQHPPHCPDGAYGEVGECYVLVAPGPGMTGCPEGSIDTGSECRRPVADVEGAFYCADPAAVLNGTHCVFVAPYVPWCALDGGGYVDPESCQLDVTFEAAPDCPPLADGLETTCWAYAPIPPVCEHPLMVMVEDGRCRIEYGPLCEAPVDGMCKTFTDPIPTGQITGAIWAFGEDPFGIKVCAMRAGFDHGYCVWARSDGGFVIEAPPGNYQVTVTDPSGQWIRACPLSRGDDCAEPEIMGLGTDNSITEVFIRMVRADGSGVQVVPIELPPTPTPVPPPPVTPVPIPTPADG